MISFAPRPRAEIEAAQHEAAAAFRAPEVEVLGLDEVLALRAPSVVFRGRTHHHRPISFAAGVELVRGRLSAVQRAELLHDCIRPRGWRGWLWRWRRRALRAATEAEVRDLVRQLTEAPADTLVMLPAGGAAARGRTVVDQLRRVGEFAVWCPWGVDATGTPVSWRTFLHGLRWIDQERARQALSGADAVGVGFGGDEHGTWRAAARARAFGRAG